MTNDDEVALDATLDVLADSTRRRLLDKLQETGGMSMERVVVELADENEPCFDDPPPADERERIEVSLRHVHLPKMAEAGTIDWNPGTGQIVPNGNTKVAYDLMAI